MVGNILVVNGKFWKRLMVRSKEIVSTAEVIRAT
jgi:hypothetical protein